ncbi:c-type cytochrome [Frateuria aurantia]
MTMSPINRFVISVVLAGGLATATHAQTAVSDNPSGDLIAQGQYLATASDCAACHTRKGGQAFAGGLGIVSPVGTIYASNITPSRSAGIGDYTESQFAAAVREGIRRDGSNLYPAMPYTAYTVMSDQDIHALYAYFMHGVAPVDTPAPKTQLPFPMNIRMSMKGWNMLFLSDHRMKDDPGRSAQWNRGRYLVEGPAHCSTCHTPRGFMMQEEKDKELGGSQVGAWFAPNVTPDPVSGIGSWSQAELVRYLQTGHLPGKAQAAGSMGEAVEHSFQHLSLDDLNAMAIYVRSLPAFHTPGVTHTRFGQGQAGNALSEFRGKPFDDAAAHASGAQLFQGNCASCHSESAQGSKDGYYPSLFHNSVTGGDNPNNLIATILNGVDRTTAQGQAYMPGFGGGPSDLNALSDQQIAELATYVLAKYGHGDVRVTAQQVAVVRAGGPASDLVELARWGMSAGAVIVLLLLGWWLRRRKAHA